MKEIEGLMKFAELMNKFREIERVVLIHGSDRMENDVEHSYQLAMCAWYLISVNKLSLDIDVVIKYSLIHDLVEVYAGDTFAYDKNPEAHASKEDREHKALIELKNNFAEFPDFTSAIESYEKREDEESRFVYALDKVVAPINIYMDGGRIWQLEKITLDMHKGYKKEKVKVHPEVAKYYDQLLELFKNNEKELFHHGEG